MILQILCDVIPRRNDGDLNGNDGHWLPPPVMQTCRQLRSDGLSIFVTLHPVFTIADFATSLVSSREKWAGMIYAYYGLKVVGSSMVIRSPTSMDIALPNLEIWLQDFYVSGLPGLLLEKDCQGMGEHCHHMIDEGDEEDVHNYE